MRIAVDLPCCIAILLVLAGEALCVDHPWWDSDWKYRARVDLAPGAELTAPCHIRIILDETSLPGLNLAGSAGDIRFVWQDDDIDGEAFVARHWLHDDRITHGAWYSCCRENGYTQYHTPAATYYTTIRPNGIRFVGRYDRSYFVYGDYSRDPAIRYYDNSTGILSEAVIAGRTPILGDAHGNPSLLIDDEGYIYVFFGCHHHPIRMRRSKAPENILEWEEEVQIDVAATYPQPYMLDSRTIITSFREYTGIETAGWGYVTSTSKGQEWSSCRLLVNEPKKFIYALSEVVRNSLDEASYHLVITPFNYDTSLYENIYYIRSDDGMGTFQASDGTVIAGEPPFTLSQLELVYENADSSSHVNDFAIGGDGTPYILFNEGPWSQAALPAPGEWKLARRSESGWVINSIAPCNHLFDRGCLLVDRAPRLRAFLPVGHDLHDGGEMVEYSSEDNGHTWELSNEITRDSELSHNYAVRVLGAAQDFQVFWSFGSSEPCGSSAMNTQVEVMLWGERGIIGTADDGRVNATLLIDRSTCPGQLYVYYDNPSAPPAGKLDGVVCEQYSSVVSGEPDGEILVEWLTEDSAPDLLKDFSGHGNDGIGFFDGGEWLFGGSCPGRRYDLETKGHIVDLNESDFISLPKLKGRKETSRLTIEIWFKPDSPWFRCQPLVNQWLECAAFSLVLNYGKVEFRTKTDVEGGGAFYTQHIAADRWHHLVAVYDGADMYVYLDGVRSSTTFRQSGTVNIGCSAIYVGKYGEAYYDGKIDELRIYTSALTEAEAMARFQKLHDNQLTGSASIQESFDQRITSIGTSIYFAAPNPFNGTTTVRYALAQSGPVKIAVYDVAGRFVRILRNDAYVEAGEYSLVWDGRNGNGSVIASGVYFCRMNSGVQSSSIKIIYLR